MKKLLESECRKLTTAIARNLEPPSGKTDHIEWDEDFPGFGIRLRVGRNRVSRMWIYQYDIAGRTRRITLGNVNAIGIDDARKIAGRLQSSVRLGNDPAQEKAEKLARAACTFEGVLKNFLEVQERITRKRTFKATSSLLGEPCKLLYPLPFATITRRDIANVLTPLAARGLKAGTNNVRNKLITFFNWAIKQGLTENNPVLGTEKQEAEARERVLSMAELVAIWRALDDMTDYRTIIQLRVLIGQRTDTGPERRTLFQQREVINRMVDYAAVIHLLMLTGQRKNEISELRWREIRADKIFIDDGLPITGPAIVLPKERVKNNHKHVVPLSSAAQAILLTRLRTADDGLVFPRKINEQALWPREWSKHKRLLDAALVKRGHTLAPWVIHDIRRSVATHMRHMGIARDTVEEVLNHFRANVYIKGQLEDQKRHALEAWGKLLMAHIEGNTSEADVDGKVVTLQDLRA